MKSEAQDELPDIGTAAPYYWRDELVGASDSMLTEDLCIVDGAEFFIRGVLEIPLVDQDDRFGWGVWVSLKKENFDLYREHYDTDAIGSFFGWLATDIDYFDQSTLNLQTTVKFVGGGTRPRIFINECDHKLRIDQRTGLTLEAAWRIVRQYQKEA